MARIPLNKFVSTVKILSATVDNGPFDYNLFYSPFTSPTPANNNNTPPDFDYRNTLIYPGPSSTSVTSILLNVQCTSLTTLSSRESITLGISGRNSTSDGIQSGPVFYYLVRNFRINKNYSSGLISGKILLQSGESLHGSCSRNGAFSISVAVLEAFNDPN